MPSNRLAAETTNDLENELDRFRNEWQRELLISNESLSKATNTMPNELKATSSKSTPGVERGQLRPVRQQASKVSIDEPEPDLDYEQPSTTEENAKYLFNKAVLLEQQGRHYDAIKFYRLSMQLDADIEIKVAGLKKPSNLKNTAKQMANMNLSHKEDDEETREANRSESDNDERSQRARPTEGIADEFKSLYERFQSLLVTESGSFCQKNAQQRVRQTKN